MVVFADTGGFVAAYDPKDRAHARAQDAWAEFHAKRTRLLTTQLVLAETVTLVRRRCGWALSKTVGEVILGSGGIEVAAVTTEQMAAAWREFLRNPDPKLSLCDTASFIVMRERGVTRAFTLDDHFRDAGFEVVPGA